LLKIEIILTSQNLYVWCKYPTINQVDKIRDIHSPIETQTHLISLAYVDLGSWMMMFDRLLVGEGGFD
jgi:hypothetical protein